MFNWIILLSKSYEFNSLLNFFNILNYLVDSLVEEGKSNVTSGAFEP